ncbi:MAG TPA: UPF0146 family protein [Candidatus Thermoplasmatota archaeon]|nr:UPF0146 family protein [Candidatus Thermoplasmatota archaeon]
MELPAPLVTRARRARVGLEVGAGTRFDTALALAGANPAAGWMVSDIDPRVLLAPSALQARLLDVTRPDLDGLEGVDLVYGVRLPEELQLSAARLARALHADLALRPLKDEWADLRDVFRTHAVWPDGWRFFPIE